MSNLNTILFKALQEALKDSGLPKAKFGEMIGVKNRQHMHALLNGKNVSSDKLEEYLSRIGISAVEVIKNHKED